MVIELDVIRTTAATGETASAASLEAEESIEVH